jgi:prepilin-type N-terminal cleavage/methylation domain-containing protein
VQVIASNYNSRKGFTLIELMVALAIIFISMTAILSFLSRYQVINIENSMRDEARSIAQNQLEQYRNAATLQFGTNAVTLPPRRFRNINLTYTVTSTIREIGTTQILTPGATTPVINPTVTRYTQENMGTTVISGFTGAANGQHFCVEILSNGNTTFNFSSGTLTDPSSTNYTASKYDVLCFVQEGAQSRRIESWRGSIAVRVVVTWQYRAVNHQYSASTIVSGR